MNTFPLATSAAGINRNLEAFGGAATRIAEKPVSGQTSKDIVDMKTAEMGVKANAEVIKATDETIAQVVDILV